MRSYRKLPRSAAGLVRAKRDSESITQSIGGIRLFFKDYRNSKMHIKRPGLGILLFLQLPFCMIHLRMHVTQSFRKDYLLTEGILYNGCVKCEILGGGNDAKRTIHNDHNSSERHLYYFNIQCINSFVCK